MFRSENGEDAQRDTERERVSMSDGVEWKRPPEVKMLLKCY